MSDRSDTESGDTTRRVATVVIVLVAPFLALGVVLTLSLFGIVFGAPLLLVTVPIALVAWKGRQEPGDPARRRRLSIGAQVLAIALSGGLLAVLFTSLGDLDLVVEWILLALAIGWVAAAWWAVVTCRRSACSGER